MNEIINNEHKILRFWQKGKIFAKLQKKNKGKKTWSFLDGPITANNPMGVHHAWGRTYKDAFQRYKAMQGFDQRFQNGFDCQGLWVEVEVEKELGFKSKKDIEEYGIAKFVKKCKDRVVKYSKIQTSQSIRLGQWMDWDNSYYTMSDENNYAIWHFLKKCWQKGLLYKGRDVVPWCLRCGTAISQHEILTEEYKEITHKSVFIKLPILEKKSSSRYLLVWTTTPWTLPANVGIAVHPDLDYVEATDGSGIIIVAKDLFRVLGGGYGVIGKCKGKDLIGLEYTGPFDDLEINKNLHHKVIGWKEVSQDEGTGLVHIAPGCGQEDFALGKEEKLEIIDPVNEEGRYKQGFGWLSNKSVKSIAEEIFKDLKRKGFLFKVEDYTHRYPTCWRCKSELIFRLVDEWYIGMDKIRKPLKDIAKKIKWIPDFGLARELDWLKNMHDWLISKKRYWGLALPIFECPCGHFEVIGGYEELKKRTVAGWKSFEGHSPHKPYIDKVKIKCPKCGKLVSRILDVGNPWLDAGIVPYSTLKYFSDKKYWKKWFPADFICESFPGQFRNWFYSLIAMSGVLENKPMAKTIFGYATVVDEQGEEMHKSKGNAIEFNEGAEKIGVDVMRWMYLKQDPANNLRFGFRVADEVKRNIMTLWNSFVFFETYVADNFKPNKNIKPELLLDKWIVSRLNILIKQANEFMDKYDAAKAVYLFDSFIDDLSNWHIRRSRQRFQRPKRDKEKDQASQVLHHCLMELSKLMAPFTPFITETIYQRLKQKGDAESIHLCDYPKADKKMIDEKLESQMEQVREIVNNALQQRATKGIKVRQPLGKLEISNKNVINNKELSDLIKEEVNVKEIILGKEIKLDTKITPELEAEGVVRDLIRFIQKMRKDGGLKPGRKIYLRFSTQSSYLKNLINNNLADIQSDITADKIEETTSRKEAFLVERDVAFNGHKIWLGVKRK